MVRVSGDGADGDPALLQAGHTRSNGVNQALVARALLTLRLFGSSFPLQPAPQQAQLLRQPSALVR